MASTCTGSTAPPNPRQARTRRAAACVAAMLMGAAGGAPAQTPVTSGDLLVTHSLNNSVMRFGFDGKKLAEYFVPNLSSPRSVALGPGDTVVVGPYADEILVLDRSPKLLRRFPCKGIKGQFGLAVSPKGEIHAIGSTSVNIGVYSVTGTLLRTLTAPEFTRLQGLAFRTDGHFYATRLVGLTGHMIVHCDSAGKVVGTFSNSSLAAPAGLTWWNNQLFVAGLASKNIVVFDRNGKLLRQIKHRDIDSPQAIAIGADGTMAVTNAFSYRISYYKSDGTHLRTVTPGGIVQMRGAVFLPTAELRSSGQPVLGRPFPITLRSPFEPRYGYAAALSLGSSPGIRLPDGRVLGLNYDAAAQWSLTLPGYVGSLDGKGEAGFVLFLPRLPWLKGVRVHVAALTVDTTLPSPFRQVTETRAFTF